MPHRPGQPVGLQNQPQHRFERDAVCRNRDFFLIVESDPIKGSLINLDRNLVEVGEIGRYIHQRLLYEVGRGGLVQRPLDPHLASPARLRPKVRGVPQ